LIAMADKNAKSIPVLVK